ncbi:RHS repeat-associated core domain-containing protein [Pseudomonas sp. SDO5532_S415]
MPNLPSVNQTHTILLAPDDKNSIHTELAGGQRNSIAYAPYGHQSAQQEIASHLGFNGELCERKIGWYFLGKGYRAYNPILMRFHSPDSWSPFGKGGWNAYMYCDGDPRNFADPTGHSLFSFIKNLPSAPLPKFKLHNPFRSKETNPSNSVARVEADTPREVVNQRNRSPSVSSNRVADVAGAGKDVVNQRSRSPSVSSTGAADDAGAVKEVVTSHPVESPLAVATQVLPKPSPELVDLITTLRSLTPAERAELQRQLAQKDQFAANKDTFREDMHRIRR